MDRRKFLVRSAVAASSMPLVGSFSVAAEPVPKNYRICAFEKFLQDFSYDQLADTIAELGFVGIEAAVRKKGHVLPSESRTIYRNSSKR